MRLTTQVNWFEVTIVTIISLLANTYIYLKAIATVMVHPQLKKVNCCVALLSGHFTDWWYYHHFFISSIVLTIVIGIFMMIVTNR